MTDFSNSIVGRTRICQYGGFGESEESNIEPWEAVVRRFNVLWDERTTASRPALVRVANRAHDLMKHYGHDGDAVQFSGLPEEALQELDAMMDRIEEMAES